LIGRHARIGAQRIPETFGRFRNAGPGQPARAHFGQQRVEQRHIAIGRHGDMQIGLFGGFGAARVDHHDLGAARGAGRLDALPHHRVAPGGVAAQQQDEIGLVQIAVAAGHHVLAKGAVVGGHGAGHAEP
jgi:hypothetical protein